MKRNNSLMFKMNLKPISIDEHFILMNFFLSREARLVNFFFMKTRLQINMVHAVAIKG